MRAHEPLDAADLLRTGHAVVRVLAAAEGEADAYPALLAAIGESLGSAGGAMWLPVARATLRPAYTWGVAPDAPEDGLSFEVPRIGVMNFTARIEPDEVLLETMHSLGLLISHFAERCRAQQAVAASVAAAEERERVLRHLATEQAALRRVATAIATESDPRDAFAVVTEEVGRLLRAPSANMIRFNDDDTATVLARWSDTNIPVHEVGAIVPLGGDSVSARVYRSAAPARVDSYDDLEGELAANLRELGHHSAVAGPIFQEGRLWGAVIVSGGSGEPFPTGAERRIASFAELAGQALASAQAREDLAASRARIVQAGDAERRRLERNLHDGAQQRLVSLALMLRLAARRHPEDANLALAGEELGHALQELRELARGIHPAVLTERGLEPAVRAVADRAPHAGRAQHGADGAAARPGRGRRLLRRRRGADERGEVRAGDGGVGGRRADERARPDRGARRRHRRRHAGSRDRAARARRPRRGARRPARDRQPRGRGDDVAGGDPGCGPLSCCAP